MSIVPFSYIAVQLPEYGYRLWRALRRTRYASALIIDTSCTFDEHTIPPGQKPLIHVGGYMSRDKNIVFASYMNSPCLNR